MFKKFGQAMVADVVLTLLVLSGLRSLVDFSFPQAIVFVCLSCVYGYMSWLKSQAVISVNDDVKRQLEEMKTGLSGMMIKQASKPQAMQQEVRRFF